MPRQQNRLTDRAIKAIRSPGYYADGGNLYLRHSEFDTKSWVVRFALNKRRREMGLGPYPDVTLKEAREEASQARKLLRKGIDPIEERVRLRGIAAANDAKVFTFREVSEEYIRLNEPSWSNRKHAAQWTATLERYAFPLIGNLPVALIETHHVQKILSEIWTTKNETAKRVRGRIEAVLDAAKVQGLRSGENPARWKGHLDKIFPKPSKVQKVEHHAALPYLEVGSFVEELRSREGVSARAFELLILTATRTSEVIGARHDEFDLTSKTWTIPALRMKSRKSHRVPLSDRAVEIIEQMLAYGEGKYVFPGQRAGSGLSNMAFLTLLRRIGRTDITAHGFRSTFRDWAAEQTSYPSDLLEMALAHAVGNDVERAYRRTDLFEKRRKLMNEWAEYCCNSTASTIANVVFLRETAR